MSNRNGFLVLLLVLLCGMSNSLLAQNRTTISGTVRDAESGETLPYASVLVTGTTLGAATNVDGYFVLLGVPADSLTLRVTYLGYQTALVEIDARMQETPLMIEMTPAAVSQHLSRLRTGHQLPATVLLSEVT